MSTKTIESFIILRTETLATVEGGIPRGWYAPFGYMSDNMICKNGYRYTTDNVRRGNCRVNWESVVTDIVANTSIALASGVGRIP